jgi:ubiquinone/menaquinone biosynthesis C-methylase UbiE
MLDTTFWKHYFEVYDLLNELTPYQELLDGICARVNIHTGDRVLDLGSGTGNLSMKLERFGARVAGVDFSKEGIEMHKSKSSSTELIHADITQPLPFPDAYFDAVVSNNVLYAISRDIRPRVAQEMYRVLKPGGRIVISNVIDGFNPQVIYFDHVAYSFKERGIFKTIGDILLLSWPTLKILYYNHLISKEHEQGSYDFFKAGEQQWLLIDAGFRDVSPDEHVYCKQGVMNYASK